jgi:predicted dehydrogenase
MNAITRRSFLQNTATTAIALAQVPNLVRAAAEGENLRVGLIGCGWYGMVDLKAALKAGGVEVIGLCDVDREHLNQSAAEIEKLQGRRPQTFKQYEELLQLEGLNAVIIATPPHWHALQLIAALNRGLDVYCEKPLAYDIREGRAMVDAVQKSGRIVQIGFQRRKAKAYQAVRDHIQSGDAGRIVCVEANIHYNAGPKDATPQPPPASLDWDLWCGPAPKIAYSPQVGHFNWRLERTTGHGHLVDWGIHLIDATRVILNEGMPKTVAATGGLYYWKDRITTPDILTAHLEFASCPVTWRHRIWGAEEYTPALANGIFFYGEKETIFVTDDRWEVIPRGKAKERQVHEANTDAGLLHMQEFLAAVRTRRAPGCLAPDAYASTTSVKLAMLAYETGGRIQWDAEQERIVGNPEAAKLLKREYRAPWQHPFAAA